MKKEGHSAGCLVLTTARTAGMLASRWQQTHVRPPLQHTAMPPQLTQPCLADISPPPLLTWQPPADKKEAPFSMRSMKFKGVYR